MIVDGLNIAHLADSSDLSSPERLMQLIQSLVLIQSDIGQKMLIHPQQLLTEYLPSPPEKQSCHEYTEKL